MGHLQFLGFIRTRRWNRLKPGGWQVVRVGQPVFVAILCFLGILFATRYLQRVFLEIVVI